MEIGESKAKKEVFAVDKIKSIDEGRLISTKTFRYFNVFGTNDPVFFTVFILKRIKNSKRAKNKNQLPKYR